MVDIKEHCYTSNERSTNKNHSKSKSEILWEVKKQPRVTFKQLKTLFVMVTDKLAPLASFHSIQLIFDLIQFMRKSDVLYHIYVEIQKILNSSTQLQHKTIKKKRELIFHLFLSQYNKVNDTVCMWDLSKCVNKTKIILQSGRRRYQTKQGSEVYNTDGIFSVIPIKAQLESPI